MRRPAVIGIALVVMSAGEAYAQPQATPSLAEVARQAEAARPTVKKATRTYTNGDLSLDLRDQAAPAPASGFVSTSLGKPVSAEEMVARSEAKVDGEMLAKQPEETWRMRATSLRTQIDQLQEQLTALTAPNPLRDATAALKTATDVRIANVRTGLDGLRKQWTRLEVSAREVKLPNEWLDPRPQFQ